MPFAIFDIDVTRPVPAVATPPGEYSGAAFFVRRGDRPVAFWMDRMPEGAALAPGEVARRTSRKAATRLLAASILEELAPAPLPLAPRSLTIAVCTRDRAERLAACLASLNPLRAEGAEGAGPVEILVVDNAPSQSAARDLVAGGPDLRYALEPRPGLDFARNRAIREARGEWLAFLDDDVAADRCWLRGLVKAWRRHPDADAVTGLVLPRELETDAQFLFERRGGFGRGFDTLRYAGDVLPGNPLYPCGAGIFGAGANMAFRTEALRALSGFDEALDTGPRLPGGGDLDIFYRMIRAGKVLVYEPEFLCYHSHRRERAALRRQCWSWGLGFMAFVVKSYRAEPAHRSRFRRLVVWWFKDQLRSLQRSVRGRGTLPPRMIAAEIIGGIAGLCGEYDRSLRRTARIRKAAP